MLNWDATNKTSPPFYNQDDDAQQAASVKRLKAEIAAAQGLLFVTPEYNRSMPDVLKNAIDHALRPYGQVRGRVSLPGRWARRSGPLALRWHNSICAMFSPTWTYRPWVSRKRLFTPKKDCLIARAISVPMARHLCKAGWISMLCG